MNHKFGLQFLCCDKPVQGIIQSKNLPFLGDHSKVDFCKQTKSGLVTLIQSLANVYRSSFSILLSQFGGKRSLFRRVEGRLFSFYLLLFWGDLHFLYLV